MILALSRESWKRKRKCALAAGGGAKGLRCSRTVLFLRFYFISLVSLLGPEQGTCKDPIFFEAIIYLFIYLFIYSSDEMIAFFTA